MAVSLNTNLAKRKNTHPTGSLWPLVMHYLTEFTCQHEMNSETTGNHLISASTKETFLV